MSERILRELERVRDRTRALIGTVSDEDLYRQHNSLMSPIAWDLGHIGNFEELWGIRSLPESPDLFPQLDEMYDAVKNPRSTRSSLPLPNRDQLFATLDAVRSGLLHGRELIADSKDRLFQYDYVYEMLLQHEIQHQETILQTLQLKLGDPYRPGLDQRDLPAGRAELRGEFIDLPGGLVEIGTDRFSGTYDNERPAHTASVEPFSIGVAPVTNGEFLEFVRDGGYGQREHWSDAGWRFVQDEAISAPMYWSLVGEVWHERVMNRVEPLNPLVPVCHICFHEAEAFARWSGKRLPTEYEWEYAARWDPESQTAREFPWGDDPWDSSRANLEISGWGRAEIGAYPNGVSTLGVEGLIGDVWEWTSSAFVPWPGFEAFPYDEYSKIFFGDEYRVLKGGSWATGAGAMRGTFRNWDYPIRRQIFAGVRLAGEVAG